MSTTPVEAALGMQSPEKAHRLAAVAEVLKANRVPQEMINLILAARCGLPMEKIDPKSPVFEWVDESEDTERSALNAKQGYHGRYQLVPSTDTTDGLDAYTLLLENLNIPATGVGLTLTSYAVEDSTPIAEIKLTQFIPGVFQVTEVRPAYGPIVVQRVLQKTPEQGVPEHS